LLVALQGAYIRVSRICDNLQALLGKLLEEETPRVQNSQVIAHVGAFPLRD